MSPQLLRSSLLLYIPLILAACSGRGGGRAGGLAATSQERIFVGTILAEGGIAARLSLPSSTSSALGTIEYLSGSSKPMPLTESSWKDGKVHIAWADARGAATIDGTLSGNT